MLENEDAGIGRERWEPEDPERRPSVALLKDTKSFCHKPLLPTNETMTALAVLSIRLSKQIDELMTNPIPFDRNILLSIYDLREVFTLLQRAFEHLSDCTRPEIFPFLEGFQPAQAHLDFAAASMLQEDELVGRLRQVRAVQSHLRRLYTMWAKDSISAHNAQSFARERARLATQLDAFEAENRGRNDLDHDPVETEMVNHSIAASREYLERMGHIRMTVHVF